MKKLNNFILFPLILGTTCLVCGGVVSAINYAVSGKLLKIQVAKLQKQSKVFLSEAKKLNLYMIQQVMIQH